MIKSCFFAVLYVLTWAGGTFGQTHWHNKQPRVRPYLGHQVEIYEGEVLIGLKQGVSREQLIPYVQDVGVIRYIKEGKFAWIGLYDSLETFATLTRIGDWPCVRFAEPCGVIRPASEPNDPYFKGTYPANYPSQWALKNTGQNPPSGTVDADIDASEAWHITTGDTSVVIAILDSGLPMVNGVLNHPDLSNPKRIIIGPDFADIGVPGADPTISDKTGHGTHVAGIAAAETNNGIGIAGVAYNCKILAIQVFYPVAPSPIPTYIAGIQHVIDFQNQHPEKRVVINFSGHGPLDQYSQTLEEKIAELCSLNIAMVVSAGNVSNNGPLEYPASLSGSFVNVISVGSTDAFDIKADYSATGPELNVVVPGGARLGDYTSTANIFSTWPSYVPFAFTPGYNYSAGTSQAAPHVSGVVALMLSVRPDLTVTQIRSFLQNTADKVGPEPYVNGRNDYYGYGRVNAYKVLLAVAPEIVSPNVCDFWIPESVDTVSWISNSAGRNFRVELSTDNGASYSMLNSSVTSASTSYQCAITVPIVYASQCKIRITDNNDNAYRNISNRFVINYSATSMPANFNVTKKNGHPWLTWTSDGSAASFELWSASSEFNYFWNPLTTITDPNATGYVDVVVNIGSVNPNTMKYKMRAFNICNEPSVFTAEKSINYEEFTKPKNIDQSEVAFDFSLKQNYPNPFNPSTTIEYAVASKCMISIKIYDALGREVSTLVEEEKPAGVYAIALDAAKFASGVYFYRMVAGEFVETKKLILVK